LVSWYEGVGSGVGAIVGLDAGAGGKQLSLHWSGQKTDTSFFFLFVSFSPQRCSGLLATHLQSFFFFFLNK